MSQITIAITRSKNGILFNVEASPQVEEFFSSDYQKNGDIQPVNLFGRLWQPTGGEDLLVYPLPEGLAGNVNLGLYGEITRLDRVGAPLIDDPNVGATNVNLSPLRLVGISRPGGITIRYEGVFSTPFLQQFLRRWQEASARFYVSLLKPVHLVGRVMKED